MRPLCRQTVGLSTADQEQNEQRWREARRRADVLSQLPERPDNAEVRDAMAKLGISRATLFRWLRLFRQDKRTSTLLARRRGPPAGMKPLTHPSIPLPSDISKTSTRRGASLR